MRYIAALLVVLLLVAVPRAAHATLGMCTITGTVYNVDGSVAKNGVVNFRLPSTQTFSADSVQTSLEHVVLDSGGNLPAGTQVPLGARIFIQVGSDKPVSVVVTTNPANCPLAFGTLVGSGAGGVPIPSTVITSITTVNNIPGITDTAVNPPGAGPATLTLSDGYPITFGSSSSAADLSGAGLSPLFTQVGGVSNGVILQDETSATANNTLLGQLAWGSTGTSATDKRAVVIDPRLNAASATNPTGRLDFYLADGSGNPLGTVGTVLQLFAPNNGTLASFTGAGNISTAIGLSNTNAGTAAQSFYSATSNAGQVFMGVRSTGWTGGDVPASYSFLESSAGTSGLYLVSAATTGDEGIHFAANSQLAAGNLLMTEDASANFFFTMPNVVQFSRNFNGATEVQVQNTTAGASSQSIFAVNNANGVVGQLSATGASSTFAAPYTANMAYVQGNTGNGLLIDTLGGAIHLAASGQGANGTLDVTEDGSDNFAFSNTNTAAHTIFQGGNPTLIALSTTNATGDILEVLPQNQTVGVATWYGGLKEIGTNGNNSMDIDAQGSGVINLNSGGGSRVDFYSSMITRSNHHIGTYYDGTSPSISSCTNGSVVAGSTDQQGTVTFSAGGATSCLINFVNAWAAAPTCLCNVLQASITQTSSCEANTSTTQLNMVSVGGISSNTGVYRWICMGQNS